MASNHYLASPLERGQDPDWANFASSTVNTAPGPGGQDRIPDSPSWRSAMDEFMDDFDPESEPDVNDKTKGSSYRGRSTGSHLGSNSSDLDSPLDSPE